MADAEHPLLLPERPSSRGSSRSMKLVAGVMLASALVAVSSICYTTLRHQDTTPVVLAEATSRAFPEKFRWAVATAAYQVEGAVTAAGRTPSIWDDFCVKAKRCNGVQTLNITGSCEPLACATVADDVFHRYKEDFAMMARMHVTSYRLSLSWSRLMTWDPKTRRMVRNPAGVAFYREMFYELRRWYIEPMVTMYHWDLPLALEENLQPAGWLNPEIVTHFEDYAALCFQEFGDLVPLWFTVNEPWTFARLGYTIGFHAPGHVGSPTEAYTVAHHVLLSHATAVNQYRELRAQGKVLKDGRISFVVNSDFGIPLDPTNSADVEDAQAYNEFELEWFLYPVMHGSYPPHMVQRAAGHLPSFSAAEKELVQGSLDGFLGLNHYTTHPITKCSNSNSTTSCASLAVGWDRDLGVDINQHPKDARKPTQAACQWLQGYPAGYGVLLDYVHSRYPQLQILLTENGWCGSDEVDDQDQLWYYKNYIAEVLKAIDRGVPIIGYTAWSLMDNYEWGTFGPRFGLWNVNYETLERVPKTAALWYAKVAAANKLVD